MADVARVVDVGSASLQRRDAEAAGDNPADREHTQRQCAGERRSSGRGPDRITLTDNESGKGSLTAALLTVPRGGPACGRGGSLAVSSCWPAGRRVRCSGLPRDGPARPLRRLAVPSRRPGLPECHRDTLLGRDSSVRHTPTSFAAYPVHPYQQWRTRWNLPLFAKGWCAIAISSRVA